MVTIKPLGLLKTYIEGQSERLVEPGQSVREALVRLGIPPEVVALVTVKAAGQEAEEQQSKDYILQEGDTVRVLAVVGGG